jgi:hypothetical protein
MMLFEPFDVVLLFLHFPYVELTGLGDLLLYNCYKRSGDLGDVWE